MSLLALLVGCSPAVAQQPAPQPAPQPVIQSGVMTELPQIVTQAVGTARTTPDRATLMISVQTRAATAEQAGTQNATRQRAVIDALRRAGLAQEQISTTGYNVQPDMRYEQNREPRVVGYVVTNTLRVEVREMTRVGPVIDAALGAGANMISSMRFYSSREDAVRREALTAAVEKARAEADALAAAAGGRVVGPLEISTVAMVGPQPRYAMEADMAMARQAAPTPIEPGEQEISAMVTVRWHFQPAR